MALKYYTLSELKKLSLDSAQRYRSAYVIDDADKAYNYAASACGYENPLLSDADYAARQYWLIEQMNLWFYKDIQKEYLTKFDVGDLKLGQVSRNLRDIVTTMETSFSNAKSASDTAYLFVNADDMFDNIVVDSGLRDDPIGNDYRETT